MHSTISRIAIAAPVAAAIFGWSLGAAQAAPYEPSDKVQVQPADNNWPDDIVDTEPEDVDEPEDGPAEEPADEPVDEPADDPADEDEESEENSDDESDNDAADDDSNDSGQPAPVRQSDDNDQGSNGESDRADAEADVVETASSTKIAPSFGPAGVKVPLLMIVGAGAILSGVAGWAGYRRYQLFAH
jgi:hypothetical protein